MTDWKAAGIGFAVGSLLQLLLFTLFFDFFSGLGIAVGGFIAGYLADGSLKRGAWHGLLPVVGWALLVVPLATLAVFTVASFDPIPPIGALGGVLLYVFLVFAFLFAAVFSALAGMVGAFVKQRA